MKHPGGSLNPFSHIKMPKSNWNGRVHGTKVERKFEELYDLNKIAILLLHDPDFDLEEILVPAISAYLKENWKELKDSPKLAELLEKCRRY